MNLYYIIAAFCAYAGLVTIIVCHGILRTLIVEYYKRGKIQDISMPIAVHLVLQRACGPFSLISPLVWFIIATIVLIIGAVL